MPATLLSTTLMIIPHPFPRTPHSPHRRCNPGISFGTWCAVDFALWTLILSAVALLGWRIFGTPRRTLKLSGLFRRKTPRARKNPRLAKLASLPFPQAADSSFDEDDLEKSEGTLVSDSLDPYHVVSKTFDASLIARANSFEPTPVPEPIFKREEFDEKAPIAAPVVFSPKLSDSSPWVFPRETKEETSPPALLPHASLRQHRRIL